MDQNPGNSFGRPVSLVISQKWIWSENIIQSGTEIFLGARRATNPVLICAVRLFLNF